ncbi:MAG: hypothetical protein J5658_08555 [Prevotella sp.]|nr:hypothetical protein [Prevotella sp.]
MAKKKLSELELILKKLGFVAKTYTDEQVAANAVHIIEQGTAETGYLKTYIFAKGVTSESDVTQDNLIGKVNIPKDFLVTAVKRVTVEAGTGALEGKWVIVSENGTAVTPYEAPSSINAAGIWALFTINVKSGSADNEYLSVNLSELIDVYTGGNGINVSNNVITIDLDANGGLEFTGSTDGAKKLAIKIDSSNANGLALTSAGLKLALATPSTAGVGGTNGAMSAQDKENLNKLNIALCSDAEIGSWFGYASNSTMVTTTLPAVSDDSIEDE